MYAAVFLALHNCILIEYYFTWILNIILIMLHGVWCTKGSSKCKRCVPILILIRKVV